MLEITSAYMHPGGDGLKAALAWNEQKGEAANGLT